VASDEKPNTVNSWSVVIWVQHGIKSVLRELSDTRQSLNEVASTGTTLLWFDVLGTVTTACGVEDGKSSYAERRELDSVVGELVLASRSDGALPSSSFGLGAAVVPCDGLNAVEVGILPDACVVRDDFGDVRWTCLESLDGD